MLEHIGKKSENVLFVIFRVIVGLSFALHGMQKFGWLSFAPLSIDKFAAMFGLPVWLAVIVALVELIAGIAIALGIFGRLAALIGGIDMIVALIITHFPKGFWLMVNGGELAILYLMVFFVIFALGSGKWALGKVLFKKELW
jgi:putative oxidoreductase